MILLRVLWETGKIRLWARYASPDAAWEVLPFTPTAAFDLDLNRMLRSGHMGFYVDLVIEELPETGLGTPPRVAQVESRAPVGVVRQAPPPAHRPAAEEPLPRDQLASAPLTAAPVVAPPVIPDASSGPAVADEAPTPKPVLVIPPGGEESYATRIAAELRQRMKDGVQEKTKTAEAGKLWEMLTAAPGKRRVPNEATIAKNYMRDYRPPGKSRI